MAAPLLRPKAVLFDWDNTLVDTWPTIAAALNETLVLMGHAPWSMAEVRQRVRASMRDSFPALFGARAEEAGQAFYAAFQRLHLEALRPLPGAAALLRYLTGSGIPVGLVSNKRGDILRRETDHLGWGGYLAAQVGANDAPRDKPDPAVVTLALAACGAQAGREVWFIGDTGIDMRCAHAAGCLPILVFEGSANDAELAAFPPEQRFGDLHALARAAAAALT